MSMLIGIVICVVALATAAQEWRHNESGAFGIALAGIAMLAVFALNG